MRADPQPPEPLELLGEPARSIELTLTAGVGREARVDPEVARRFTSVHVRTLRKEFGRGEALSATPPLATDTERARLGRNGVVSVGARVDPGDLLAGVAGPSGLHLAGPREGSAMHTAIREKRERERSLWCPPDVRGYVTSVKTDAAGVEVMVSEERPLAVGDLLRLEDGSCAVVGAMVAGVSPPAVIWPGVEGHHRVEKVGTVDDVSEARSVGAYSLITQEPLGGKTELGGQRVGRAAIDTLLDRGASALVHELLTVKSDDVSGRHALYESIVKGTPRAQASIPEGSRVLEAGLRALGFDVSFEEDQPRIRLLTTERVRALAAGEVTKPETIDHDTFRPEPGGLFCTEVFGRVSSPRPDRRRRLGRIELAIPVLAPWARGTAAALLGVSVDELTQRLDRAGEPGPGGKLRIVLTVLREQLEALDLGALEREGGRRGELAAALTRSGLRATDLLVEAWPVLPPDLRPMIPISGGRVASSDVNSLYRRVIDRSNRMRRLLELPVPDIVLVNEAVLLQQALDTLVHNGGWNHTVFGGEGHPLNSLAAMTGRPDGQLGRLVSGKRVDFSGRARAVERSDVSPGKARVPREMALEIFRPWLYSNLERRGVVTSIRGARDFVLGRHAEALTALEQVTTDYPVVVLSAGAAGAVLSLDLELWDEPVVALAPSDLAALQLGPTQVVKILVPVDPEAISEARTLLRRPLHARAAATDEGWISRAAAADLHDLGEILFGAALRQEVDPATSRQARLVLGRRP